MADPVSLRIPAALREKLDNAAKQTQRSLNAEIRMRLEWSFDNGFNGEATDQMLATEIESLRAELRSFIAEINMEISSLKTTNKT